jgi:hypothetical protein
VSNFHYTSPHLSDHPHPAGVILLHGGRMIQRLDDKIVAVPGTVLTG